MPFPATPCTAVLLFITVSACTRTAVAEGGDPSLFRWRGAPQLRGVPNPSCTAPFPFCNTSLSFQARAENLVAQLTLDEKIAQLSTYSFTSKGRTPGVSRLGIPSFNYHSEGLHGIRDSNVAKLYSTLYPQVTAMAATGNMSRVLEMAQVMGAALRAVANKVAADKLSPDKGGGLSLYGPTMNLIRDPRWGRAQESVSEDSYLNGVYSIAFVKGVQGTNAKYAQAAATCKHLAAYSLEQSDGVDRHDFNALVSAQDLTDYMAAFRGCATEGAPLQVMCAYNSINGVPACLHRDLLTSELRTSWGWSGSVVSDCDSIRDAYTTHKYATAPNATALGLVAGTDQDCGDTYSTYGSAAVKAGLLTEDVIDTALARTFLMRFKLGCFDPPSAVPFTSIPANQSDTPFGRASSLAAAREAVVLLNNSAGVLPLAADPKRRVAAIGPFVSTTSNFAGGKPDYYPNPDAYVKVVAGLASKNVTVDYVEGCKVSGTIRNGVSSAVAAATKADVTVFVGGIDASIEHEGIDRSNITLPAAQQQLLQALYDAVGPQRLVLVLMNGGPVTLPWSQGRIPTVVEAFEGGEAAGQAVADVLFGDVNPSGVMPYTVYPVEYITQVKMTDMGLRPNAASGNPGRTYRWYTGTPQWPFGFGLSYSKWKVEWSSAPPARVSTAAVAAAVGPGVDGPAVGGVTSRVTVTNQGPYDGAKVVQAYVAHTDGPGLVNDARKTLYGMQKVWLKVGESKTLTFHTASTWYCAVCVTEPSGAQAVHPGTYTMSIGHGGADELTASVAVVGARQPVFAGVQA